MFVHSKLEVPPKERGGGYVYIQSGGWQATEAWVRFGDLVGFKNKKMRASAMIGVAHTRSWITASVLHGIGTRPSAKAI